MKKEIFSRMSFFSKIIKKAIREFDTGLEDKEIETRRRYRPGVEVDKFPKTIRESLPNEKDMPDFRPGDILKDKNKEIYVLWVNFNVQSEFEEREAGSLPKSHIILGKLKKLEEIPSVERKIFERYENIKPEDKYLFLPTASGYLSRSTSWLNENFEIFLRKGEYKVGRKNSIYNY